MTPLSAHAKSTATGRTVRLAWRSLSEAVRDQGPEAEATARTVIEWLAFVALAEQCGAELVEPRRWRIDPLAVALEALDRCESTCGSELTGATRGSEEAYSIRPAIELAAGCRPTPSLVAELRRVCEWAAADRTPLRLGEIHQQLLSREHRKRHGIFYTPGAVVDYLVDRVAARLEQRDRLLDPACGSGAFLLACAARIGNESDCAQWLHGADLDVDAVLNARRAMWLALAAKAPGNWRPVARQLSHSIQWVDSLGDENLAATAGRYGIVIGNPPYRRERGAKPFLDQWAGSKLAREHRAGRMDLWYYFLHLGLNALEPGGQLAMIVPSYWTASRGAGHLVEALRGEGHIDEIALLDGDSPFEQAAGRHLILCFTKQEQPTPTTIRQLDAECLSVMTEHSLPATELFRHGRMNLDPVAVGEQESLAGCPALGELGQVRQGVVENPAEISQSLLRRFGSHWRLGEGVFVLRADEVESLGLSERERQLMLPYHDLPDLGRYRLDDASRWLIYATAETWPCLEDCQVLARHLARFRPIMEARRETQAGRRAWWHLHWPRDARIWPAPKLVALQMAERPSFVPALVPVCVPFSANVFVRSAEAGEHLCYLAALLNSRLLAEWFARHAKRRGVGLDINGHVLSRAPIRRIDFARADERAEHDRLVELVTQRMAAALTETRDIEAEIDARVERLYGRSTHA